MRGFLLNLSIWFWGVRPVFQQSLHQRIEFSVKICYNNDERYVDVMKRVVSAMRFCGAEAYGYFHPITEMRIPYEDQNARDVL